VNLINSTTPYEYDLRTQTYLQPKFAYQTLQRLQTVNSALLMTLTTQRKFVFERREVPLGTSLFDFIGVALKDPTSAPIILDALVSELGAQTKYAFSSMIITATHFFLDIQYCSLWTTSRPYIPARHTVTPISTAFALITSQSRGSSWT
jgi:small subunit ribosomal protein S29